MVQGRLSAKRKLSGNGLLGTKDEVLDDDFTAKTPFDNHLFVEASDGRFGVTGSTTCGRR